MGDRSYTNKDYDLVLIKGAEFQRKVSLPGISLKDYLAVQANIFEFPDLRYAEFIPMAAEIIDALKGDIQISKSSTETAALNFRNKRFYWSLFLQQPDEEWRRVLGGRVTLVM